MRWEELPAVMDDWAVKTAAPACAVRAAVGRLFVSCHAGHYYSPPRDQVAIYAPGLPTAQFELLKSAASRAVGRDHVREVFLTLAEVEDGGWVKVAHSHTLRRLGELLNFFPGEYPGGVPNHPSPVAAMLTSALLGGGLGYGAGYLAEKALPAKFGKNLKRTGALLGGAAGAAPGALWALANARTNHSVLDSWPFTESTRPASSLLDDAPDRYSTMDPTPVQPPKQREVGLMLPREKITEGPDPARLYPELSLRKLGSEYVRAVAAFCKRAAFDGMAGFGPKYEPTPYDVNVNHLGQVLWQTGASAPLLGSAMGTMYAAQHMPDPNARSGWATAGQLGQLAMNAGKDYVAGLALGALVNQTIGTPFAAPALGVGAAALGLVRAGLRGLFQ